MALIKLNQIKNGTQLKSDVENLKNTLSAETLADNEAFSSKYVLKENIYTKDEIDAKILTAQGGEIDKEAVNKQLEQIITDDTDNHIVSPTELQEALSEYTKTADLKTAQGESAYDVAKKNGFKGTEAEWLKSLNGKAATITVGNVTSGETASVINSGTDSAAVFDFVLPQPHDGKSAYEVAKNNGFEGTEAEWLQSLKGEKGDQGEDAAPYDDTAIKKQIQDLSGKVDAIKVPDTSNLATKDELKGVSDKVDTLPTTDNIVTKDQLDSYVPMSTYEELLKRVSALESNGSNPSSGSEPTPSEDPTDKPSEPVDDDPTAESKVL